MYERSREASPLAAEVFEGVEDIYFYETQHITANPSPWRPPPALLSPFTPSTSFKDARQHRKPSPAVIATSRRLQSVSGPARAEAWRYRHPSPTPSTNDSSEDEYMLQPSLEIRPQARLPPSPPPSPRKVAFSLPDEDKGRSPPSSASLSHSLLLPSSPAISPPPTSRLAVLRTPSTPRRQISGKAIRPPKSIDKMRPARGVSLTNRDTSPPSPVHASGAPKASPSTPSPAPPPQSRESSGNRRSPRRPAAKRKYEFTDTETDEADGRDEYVPMAMKGLDKARFESGMVPDISSSEDEDDGEDEPIPTPSPKRRRFAASSSPASSSAKPKALRNPSGQGRNVDRRRASDTVAQQQKRNRVKKSDEAHRGFVLSLIDVLSGAGSSKSDKERMEQVEGALVSFATEEMSCADYGHRRAIKEKMLASGNKRFVEAGLGMVIQPRPRQ